MLASQGIIPVPWMVARSKPIYNITSHSPHCLVNETCHNEVGMYMKLSCAPLFISINVCIYNGTILSPPPFKEEISIYAIK